MRFVSLGSKRSVKLTLVVLGLLLVEFIFLEGTFGVSLPSGRYSAISRLEMKTEGLDDHFITHNYRFNVVDSLIAHGTQRQRSILRESFVADRNPDAEGPADATVTVQGLRGTKVQWTFREPAQRGDAVTDNLYMVTKGGGGEAPNVYTYFSLVDGRRVRIAKGVALSTQELVASDGSVIPN